MLAHCWTATDLGIRHGVHLVDRGDGWPHIPLGIPGADERSERRFDLIVDSQYSPPFYGEMGDDLREVAVFGDKNFVKLAHPSLLNKDEKEVDYVLLFVDTRGTNVQPVVDGCFKIHTGSLRGETARVVGRIGHGTYNDGGYRWQHMAIAMPPGSAVCIRFAGAETENTFFHEPYPLLERMRLVEMSKADWRRRLGRNARQAAVLEVERARLGTWQYPQAETGQQT